MTKCCYVFCQSIWICLLLYVDVQLIIINLRLSI